MDRTEVEKITQSPLTFKSTFSISPAAFLFIDTVPIRSEKCGLGWAFRIEKTSPPVAPTGQPVSRRGKKGVKRAHATDTAITNGTDALPPAPTVIIRSAVLYLEMEPTTIALSGQFTVDRVACQIDTTSLGERCFDKTVVVFSPETILGTFDYASTDIVSIAVSVELGHRTDAVSKSIDGRVATTLEDSLQSGDMVDAKIYTYSKRCGYKQAGHPRAMYVNLAILHKFGCEELDLHLTTQGFKDSKTTALDLYCVAPEDMVTDQYDYDSDSDLEDGDELDGEGDAVASTEGTDELAQDLIYMQGESKNRFLRTGRAVSFRATAYRTWSAFVRYVYFDTTAYAKLKSTYSDEKEAAARFTEKTCSPKSMYRFAEQFGIESLEASALESIKNQLTVDNIVDELFSQFSSHYPKVIEAEVEFLLRNFTDEKVRAKLQDVAGRAFAGGTYMEAAWKKMLAEMQVTSSSRACSYNQYCNRCGSYHQYHHD